MEQGRHVTPENWEISVATRHHNIQREVKHARNRSQNDRNKELTIMEIIGNNVQSLYILYIILYNYVYR